MQWPEHGKVGQIGLVQRKSVDKMYVGCRGQGRGSRWAQELWYSLVHVQPVLQCICDEDMPMTLFPVILCLYHFPYCSLPHLSQSQYLHQPLYCPGSLSTTCAVRCTLLYAYLGMTPIGLG